jgi:hypothetical protein
MVQVACLAVVLGEPLAAQAQGAQPDETCTKVRQVFIGMNDIAKKGNTKIVPFSKPYEAELVSYFDRGCPKDEIFPLPKPGLDMQLANTCADVVAGGKIKMQIGQRLLR